MLAEKVLLYILERPYMALGSNLKGGPPKILGSKFTFIAVLLANFLEFGKKTKNKDPLCTPPMFDIGFLSIGDKKRPWPSIELLLTLFAVSLYT